ncbi:MAG: 16S rRNA (guanine(527)-N(7))-methyltransferase RsmG [Rhizobiales bacterium]|nr:16S rRNA (guanine(527)-N(7))-methyltransferase RsmG [Hyphomicrobiales bacterium]
MAQPGPLDLLGQFNVSRESLDRLERYVSLLLTWQRRINLIGPSTADQIWQRHIADSLQLLPLMGHQVQSIADLGAGAGLPGLVIAIVSGVPVHLYESNGKKAAFLREAIRHTGAPATVHPTRIETVRHDASRPDVQLVLARALAPLDQLLGYAAPFMERGATGLFHKGQDVDAELTAAAKCWKLVYHTHPSMIDSNGVILEVKEAIRVQS